jgi:hypothetical protein
MGNAGITLEHCLNLDSGYICVNPESMHLVLVPFRIRKTDSMLTRTCTGGTVCADRLASLSLRSFFCLGP